MQLKVNIFPRLVIRSWPSHTTIPRCKPSWHVVDDVKLVSKLFISPEFRSEAQRLYGFRFSKEHTTQNKILTRSLVDISVIKKDKRADSD